MRLEHSDYIKLVIGSLNKKRTNNELSPLLAQPTPANIRRECSNVYQERYDKKDEQMLRAFFGPAEHGRQFLNSIREFETDRFRPLDTYLKGEPRKLNHRNLELLAWLIDFQHRPYVFGKNVLLSNEELSLINNPVSDLGKNGIALVPKEDELEKKEEKEENLPKNETEEIPEKNGEKSQVFSTTAFKKNNSRDWIKKLAIFFLILMICTGGTYIIWQEKREQVGCMYWAYDHYEKVPCNEEDKGRDIRGFNEKKYLNFKRITKEDTITEKSIDNIYYVSIDGTNEYYTSGGRHPVKIDRNLKKLSRYIFEKHLRKKEDIGKDSLTEQERKFVNNR